MTTARFGSVTLTALVVANMIGAGVFTTSGFALETLGSPLAVLAAWAIGGVIALCGAASYGALARRMQASGGEYLYLSRALHPAAGYVAGWVSLLAGFTGAIAFAATAFEAYCIPAGTRPAWLPEDVLALVLVGVSALVHARAVDAGARGQNLLVAVKLALIAGFLVYAFAAVGRWQGGGTIDTMRAFGAGDFALSVMWISLSYSGFNAAVYVAGEARHPARSVPRALLAGTLLVTLLYLALNAVFLLAPTPAAIVGAADVAALAAGALGGETGATVLRIIVALALASSVSSMMMAGPRVYARMAEDGWLPRSLRPDRHGAGAAVWAQAGLAAGVIVVSDLAALLSWLGFTLSISAALTVATLFVIRRREGAAALPVPGYPWVPAVFVGATLTFALLAALRRPAEPLVGLATIAAGLGAWWLCKRRT